MAELVDKQAALAEIDATIEGSLQRPEDVYIDKGLMMARTLIDKLSTIDAEPVRHAHWTFRDEDTELIKEGILPANMWCSCCGEHHDNDDYGDAYCSCCGAKMCYDDDWEG